MIEPVTAAQAERVLGRRVDRRRRYAILEGELCERSSYSVNCTGCSCDCGDGYPCSHEPGGCHECGYTGRRRCIEWTPVAMAEQFRAIDAEYHRERKGAA